MVYFNVSVEEGDNASTTGLTPHLTRETQVPLYLKICGGIYVAITSALFIGGMYLLIQNGNDVEFQTLNTSTSFLFPNVSKRVHSEKPPESSMAKILDSSPALVGKELDISGPSNMLTDILNTALSVPVLGYNPALINTSVDPCSNFFDFACGLWDGTNPPPPFARGYRLFSLDNKTFTAYKDLLESPQSESDIEAVNQAKSVYRGCMSDKASSMNIINHTTDCVDRVRRIFIWALQHKLIQRQFSSQDEYHGMLKKVSRVFMHVKKQIRKLVIKAGKYDQAKVRETMRRIRLCIGYPNWLMNATAVQDIYKKHTMPGTTNKDFMKHWSITDYFISEDPSCTWKIHHQVNPRDGDLVFNDLHNLRIYTPMGVLQPPWFYSNGALSKNFGGLGNIFGRNLGIILEHELGWRAFSAYPDPRTCLVNNSNGTYRPNTKNLAKKRWADFVGIQGAFAAHAKTKRKENLQMWERQRYSTDQNFFLTYTQEFCSDVYEFVPFPCLKLYDRRAPARERTVTILQNTKEFAEAWKCPRGSLMNPVDKCNI